MLGETIDRAELARTAGPVPHKPWVILDYDTRQFPFAEALRRDVYKVPDMGKLHIYVQQHYAKCGITRDLDHTDNLKIREMMQNLPKQSTFSQLYHSFMLKVLARLCGRGISYSSNPKMRVHFPGTGSVSSFHHDIIVTKRIDQINFWLPFNTVDDTATLWLESDYGREDYRPVRVEYGQVLIFDGGYIGHGSVFNETNITRTSMDMRFSFKGASTRADGVELMNKVLAK